MLLLHPGVPVQFHLNTSAVPSASVRWYYRPGFAGDRGGMAAIPVEEAEMGSR